MGKHKATKTIHQTSQILRSPVSSLTHPRFPWFPKVPRSVARSGGSRTQLTLELWRFDHKTNWDMFLLKFDVQPSHRYTLKVWLSHAKPWNIEVLPLMLKNFTIKIKKNICWKDKPATAVGCLRVRTVTKETGKALTLRDLRQETIWGQPNSIASGWDGREQCHIKILNCESLTHSFLGWLYVLWLVSLREFEWLQFRSSS